jgi:hypothetical protein
MGLMSFGSITMDALLFALDWLVAELEYHYLLKRADSLCDYLEHLDTVIPLNEIRQSPEYRSIRSK